MLYNESAIILYVQDSLSDHTLSKSTMKFFKFQCYILHHDMYQAIFIHTCWKYLNLIGRLSLINWQQTHGNSQNGLNIMG